MWAKCQQCQDWKMPNLDSSLLTFLVLAQEEALLKGVTKKFYFAGYWFKTSRIGNIFPHWTNFKSPSLSKGHLFFKKILWNQPKDLKCIKINEEPLGPILGPKIPAKTFRNPPENRANFLDPQETFGPWFPTIHSIVLRRIFPFPFSNFRFRKNP